MKERIDRLLAEAAAGAYEARTVIGAPPPAPVYPGLPPLENGYYVRLCRAGRRPFWCWYAPGARPDLPLLLVSPGYRAELLRYPRELAARWNVLMVSPLGYFTPEGPDRSLLVRGAWPVLFHTALGGPDSYEEWLLDAMTAVRWAGEAAGADTGAMAFTGTSQGGGMSLVLGGIYQGRCAAVCADEPFLVGFSGDRLEQVIDFAARGYPCPVVSYAEAARRLAIADPVRYADRLTCPVLLGAGERDGECPPAPIRALGEALRCPARYVLFPGRPHGYDPVFHRAMLDFLSR